MISKYLNNNSKDNRSKELKLKNYKLKVKTLVTLKAEIKPFLKKKLYQYLCINRDFIISFSISTN